ncbi:MAG: carboxypeptidase-like regulatory domain-containing protein [Bacteroidia bacterium]|nr:carboxypeptidase-like regulatory domain-containing protein [Bacteroidia bacterium]
MFRKLICVLSAFLIANGLFAQSGTLKGKVIDEGTNEPIPFANVTIEENGKVLTGGTTDFDGNYTIKPVTPGKYTVKASYVGYTASQINGCVIKGGVITFQDFKLKSSTKQLGEVEVKDYKIPLIDKDQTQTGGAVTSEDIKKMPGRSATSIATTVGGVYSQTGGEGDVNIRGARSEGTVYYVDGVKVIGSSAVPKSALEQVTVITGGLPAQYGDATGGIISVTTKGPSNKMNGAAELQTTQFLDAFGSTIVGLNLMGPLYVKKEEGSASKKALLGFLLSTEFTYEKDNAPSILGRWKVKDDILDSISNHPLRKAGVATGGFFQGSLMNAEFLRSENFEKIKTSLNANEYNLKVAGKIDYQPSKNFNITVGGTYQYVNYHAFNYSFQLFNWYNNPQVKSNNWRIYARLTQKFSNQSEEQEKKSASLIKNAFYSIQADYSRVSSYTQDPDHKDNFFKYGNIGKFKTYRVRSYQWGTDTSGSLGPNGLTGWIHNGFMDTAVTFQPSEYNREGSLYTQQYYNLYPEWYYHMNLTDIQMGNGLLNGDAIPAVYSIWNSPGTPYNGYSHSASSQFRITASGSADVKDHELSLGFEFEQRSSSAFSVNDPVGLWTTARQLMNNHMIQLDLSDPNPIYDANGVFQDTIYYNRLYNKSEQALFDINFRKHLGLPVDGNTMNDYVDVDSYDPSEFSIDYFSADELLNNGVSLVSYFGFDHHGRKLSGKPSLNDFFTATFTDENGNLRYKREIAPFQPTYVAGYIQDKFAFNDLIFNIGMRIDRYDANQMVLKDPYCFYETYKAGDTDPDGLLTPGHPANIGGDYVVYVDNIDNPTSIVGYRDGKTWYSKDGTEINDPTALFSATGIAPYLVNADAKLDAKAFKDYEPQAIFMPRISFSFPISDEALFFAHYDILSKRPSYYNRLNPVQYLFIDNPNIKQNPINNPDQMSEKTIDYELGFQQKLGNTSSLKLSAFYREMRDMQQVINYYGAYPTNYMTYGNLDFGTVKGVTLQYDLRRTYNVQLRANYTLQFANATGSDLETSISLIKANQPNLRTTIPTDFDQRHAINVTLDYRFDGKASGIPYDGPQWGRRVFENAGVNLIISSGSGTPYSKRLIGGNTLIGSINGSRMPWNTSMSIRIDKDLLLTFGEGEKRRNTMLNVYMEISNILNAKNYIAVYSTTGNPDDNGYLTAPQNQSFINSRNDPEAYRNYYSMSVNNPGSYVQPRRIWLGVQFGF